jgi:5-bromo-4-chloroindolyl phosphate hydrolysis protein
MESKKVYSPLPYYIVAGVWLICAFTIRMYRLSDFLILAAVSIVVFILAQKIFPPKTVQVRARVRPVVSGDKSVDQILEEGRGYIKKLRELNDKIDDERLSAGMDRLEEISGSIFDYIAKHPDKTPKIRRFVNYYLPSTMKMLETYYTMSSQGVRRENISQTMERIEKVMDSLIVAYEKQLDILFSDEAIDISTDIDVLEGMFAQEGLGGSDFKKQ